MQVLPDVWARLLDLDPGHGSPAEAANTRTRIPAHAALTSLPCPSTKSIQTAFFHAVHRRTASPIPLNAMCCCWSTRSGQRRGGVAGVLWMPLWVTECCRVTTIRALTHPLIHLNTCVFVPVVLRQIG